MIGYPSTQDFLKLIDKNLILNCPIERGEVLAAEGIFGPNVHALKGKTVRHGKLHVKSDLSSVPHDILSLYQEVTLCVDIMYVNKIPFLITVSQHIKFATIELLANRQEETIGKGITNVMHLYGSRGFLVNMTHANGKLKRFVGGCQMPARVLMCAPTRNTFPRLNVSSGPLKSKLGACTTLSLFHSSPFS
jgi:hypothetical protein